MLNTLFWEKKWKRDVWFSPFMMDLRSIALYLQLKGMNGREIDDDLVTTLPDLGTWIFHSEPMAWPGAAASAFRNRSRFD
jgi:hypothetical protein